MSQTASFLYSHEIVRLSNALFNHQFEEANFFNSRLVNYLSSYLPFDYVAAVSYDDKLEYVSVADRVGMHFADHSYASFWHQDKCGRYISQYLLSKNICNIQAPMMFKSTDIISPEEYERSNYVSYLKPLSVHYSVSLPFGQNGRFRLVFYKKRAHGDFCDNELDLLSNIHTMIFSSNLSFENIRNRNEVSRLKSELLSESDVGVVIINEDMEVLDYNSIAVVMLQRLTNCMDIHGASSHLIRGMMDIENIRQLHQPASFCQNGCDITVSPGMDMGKTGINKKCYMIYIKNHPTVCRASAASENAFDSLTSRELQVVKCLAEGMTYQETSESLFISLSTVRKHLQNIFCKLEINNQRKLISLYLHSMENGA